MPRPNQSELWKLYCAIKFISVIEALRFITFNWRLRGSWTLSPTYSIGASNVCTMLTTFTSSVENIRCPQLQYTKFVTVLSAQPYPSNVLILGHNAQLARQCNYFNSHNSRPSNIHTRIPYKIYSPFLILSRRLRLEQQNKKITSLKQCTKHNI